MRDLLAAGHLERVDELALNLLVLGAGRPALDHLVERAAERRQLVGAPRGQAGRSDRPPATADANCE